MSANAPIRRFDPRAVDLVLAQLKGDRPWSEFARDAGVDPTVLSSTRHGHRPLTIEMIDRIASKLGEPAAAIFAEIAYQTSVLYKMDLNRALSDRIRPGPEMVALLVETYDLMEAGDEVVSVACDPFLELDAGPAQDGVFRAACRGVGFLYVFPALGRNAAADVEGPIGLRTYMLRVRALDLGQLMDDWKGRLVERLKRHLEIKSDDLGSVAPRVRERPERLKDRLRSVGVLPENGRLFFTPGVRFTLTRDKKSGRRAACAEVRYKAENVVPAQCSLLLPDDLTEVLDLWCDRVTERASSG